MIVEAHHRRGEPFHIRIELGVPGKELVVTHEPTLKHEEQGEWHKHLEVEGPHKDVYVAIRDAFKAMESGRFRGVTRQLSLIVVDGNRDTNGGRRPPILR